MISPIIICNGILRSGSTWSYNVSRSLAVLLAQRRGEPFGTAYMNRDSLDRFLGEELTSRDGPMVIKGHDTGRLAMERIRAGRALAICTLRDPRDCVASDLKFRAVGFDASVQRVVSSLNNFSASLDFGHTLYVRYEEMMADRRWQIKRIAAHLQIDVSAEDVEAIDGQSNLRFSQGICEGLSARTDEGTDLVFDHRRDRVTLLQDNHVGTAEVGRWKHELTAEQGRTLTQLFQQTLRVLGYECAE